MKRLSLYHEQLVSMKFSHQPKVLEKRSAARIAGRQVVESLETDSVSYNEVSLKPNTSPGSLNCLFYKIQDGSNPFVIEEYKTPSYLLVLYHYRSSGLFPVYENDVFTEEWLRDKVSFLSDYERQIWDKINPNVLFATSILSVGDNVSLHVVDRDKSKFRKVFIALKSLSAVTDRIAPNMPDFEDDKDEELSQLRMKLSVLCVDSK